MKIHVFDKVKWHFPDGKNCLDLNHALRHFKQLIHWLQKNELLNTYGKEIAAVGIDVEFSITSEMLTNTANQVLMAKYDDWLKTVRYEEISDFSILDVALAEIR